jgi:hypothetical protein
VGTDSGADAGASTGTPPAPDKYDVGDGQASGGGDDQTDQCTGVDLLFVIDSSGSMADEQTQLINSFDGFISGIKEQLSAQTYHVGVISSDAYAGNAGGCQQLGALVTQTSGEGSSSSQCEFAAGRRFMDGTDDLGQLFSCAAKLGISGSGDERPIEATVAAVDGSLAGVGCNDGFLRDEALLVIVLITDEEDDHEGAQCNSPFGGGGGSAGEPEQWYADVVAAKGGREEAVVVLSLVGPDGGTVAMCPGLDKCADGIIGAEPAHRLLEFTRMFEYGFEGRICEEGYDTFFTESIEGLVEACNNLPPQG